MGGRGWRAGRRCGRPDLNVLNFTTLWVNSADDKLMILHNQQKSPHTVRSTFEECPIIDFTVCPWTICEPPLDSLWASLSVVRKWPYILCLLVGVVHHDCVQYTALIVVAHIKGWSYLSNYEAIITVWSLFRWGQKEANEYNLIKCSLFYLNYLRILILL